MKTEHLKEATRLGIDVVNSVNVMERLVDALLVERAEYNTKLAEQQAWLDKISRLGCEPHIGNSHGNVMALIALKGDTTELSTLLAKAKEEGRAEAQARIKVLEDALRDVSDDLGRVRGNIMSCGHGWPCGCSKSKALKALSTTSPTEALDKVVREAVEKCANMGRLECEKTRHVTLGKAVYDAIQFLKPYGG